MVGHLGFMQACTHIVKLARNGTTSPSTAVSTLLMRKTNGYAKK